MKSYTVRDIPPEVYKKLRIKAAEGETSINKTILKSIEKYIKKGDMINDCEGCEHNFGWSIDCRLPSLTPCPIMIGGEAKWEVQEPPNKKIEHGQTKCSVKSICNVFKEGNCTDYPCPGYTSAG